MKLIDYQILQQDQQHTIRVERIDTNGDVRAYLDVIKYRLFFQTDDIGIQTYDVPDHSEESINRALKYLTFKQNLVREINNRINTNAGNEDGEDTSREDMTRSEEQS